MALALVVALGTIGASTAFAAKPGGLVGDIELAGAVTDGVGAYAAPTALKYGGAASFEASVTGTMAPKGYLYITVVCTQGSTVVYQWSSLDLDFAFPLVDQAGQGLEWDGSAADCGGYLIYRVDGRNPLIQTLDATAFFVQGS
jgi:hypothetical protein